MNEPSPYNSARSLISFVFGCGIHLQPKETTLTVGTTAVAAGTLGNQRCAITFANPGTNLIVVGLSPSVTAASGFCVPVGGNLSFVWYFDGEIVMRDFYAISGSSNQTLYICESVLSVVN